MEDHEMSCDQENKVCIKNHAGQAMEVQRQSGSLRYSMNDSRTPIDCTHWIIIGSKQSDHDTEVSLSYPKIVELQAQDDRLQVMLRNDLAQVSAEWVAVDWGFELVATVKNLGDGVLHSVAVRLDNLDMPSDAVFAIPHGAGFLIPADELEDDARIHLHYPVYCSMQWFDLFDDTHGIYMGTRDLRARSKFLTAGKAKRRSYMEISFPDIRIVSQDSYELPVLQLMVHEGDWRRGAEHYRDWFDTNFSKPDAPVWCKEKPAWAWASCKGHFAEEPKMTYSQLSAHGRQFFDLSISALQVAGYLNDGHDSQYPEYEAGAAMGGVVGLQKSSRDIHAGGNKLALYTNGRLANPATRRFVGNDWRGWCVTGLSAKHIASIHDEFRYNDINTVSGPFDWDPGETALKERYGNVDFAVMCPGSPQWRDLFNSELEELARTFDLDGIYIDQICGAWGLVCYGDGHEHERPCDAWSGYHELLDQLRKRLHALNEDIYLATEGVNDLLGLNIDLFQVHNWDFKIGLPKCARPAAEIFITALPRYLLYLGPVFLNDYTELRRTFAYGRGIDVAIESLAECETDFVEELRFLTETRPKYCPELLAAVPEPLLCEERIKCFAFHLSESRQVILGAALDLGGLEVDRYIPGLPEWANRRIIVRTPSGETIRLGDADGGMMIEKGSKLWIIETI